MNSDTPCDAGRMSHVCGRATETLCPDPIDQRWEIGAAPDLRYRPGEPDGERITKRGWPSPRHN